MGREIMRVALDFDAPINETWAPRLQMPTLPGCPECGGDGYSTDARAVANTFYPHQITDARTRYDQERRAWHDKITQDEVDYLLSKDLLRTCVKREPTEDNPRDWEWVALPRTAAEVNAEQHAGGFRGHDAINRFYLIEFRCKAKGIEPLCPRCAGHGHIGTPEQVAAQENWKMPDPPEGEGWQLWQTVSEGGPITPVLPDRQAFIDYLVTTGDAWDGPWRREAAEAFVGDGWAPSFIGVGGELLKGGVDSDKIAEAI